MQDSKKSVVSPLLYQMGSVQSGNESPLHMLLTGMCHFVRRELRTFRLGHVNICGIQMYAVSSDNILFTFQPLLAVGW